MRLIIAVTSVATLNSTWSTVHLAHAALRLGIGVRFLEPRDFEITVSGRLVVRAFSIDPPSPGLDALSRRLTELDLPRRYVEPGPEDMLLLRVNPLRVGLLANALLAEEAGIPVVNAPMGIARTRTKAWLATLAGVPRPEGVATRSRSAAQAFAAELGEPVVVKPALGSGGYGVSLVKKGDARGLDRALDLAFAFPEGMIVVQRYLPEAEQGEKRLFWVKGQLLGAYRRQRSPGEFRHNLKQGGQPEACDLEESDRRIAASIGPHLERNGIRIAGLDVIGDKLVEVNTLNPGGIHHAERLRSQDGRGIAESTLRLLLGESPAIRDHWDEQEDPADRY